MVYSESIRLAMDIASNIHSGQVDKGGYPYLFHLIHVAEQFNSENEIIVALLHDSLEDTVMTVEKLCYYGFSQEVIGAIVAMTRKKDEKYFDYINRLSKNKLARKIKIQDLTHNLEARRLGKETKEDINSLMKRYEKALFILTGCEIKDAINEREIY